MRALGTSYPQLAQEHRYQIYALLIMGHSQTEIAMNIGVNKSTISRELQRNRGKRGYRPKQAHRFAVKRLRNVSKSKYLQKHGYSLTICFAKTGAQSKCRIG